MPAPADALEGLNYDIRHFTLKDFARVLFFLNMTGCETIESYFNGTCFDEKRRASAMPRSVNGTCFEEGDAFAMPRSVKEQGWLDDISFAGVLGSVAILTFAMWWLWWLDRWYNGPEMRLEEERKKRGEAEMEEEMKGEDGI